MFKLFALLSLSAQVFGAALEDTGCVVCHEPIADEDPRGAAVFTCHGNQLHRDCARDVILRSPQKSCPCCRAAPAEDHRAVLEIPEAPEIDQVEQLAASFTGFGLAADADFRNFLLPTAPTVPIHTPISTIKLTIRTSYGESSSSLMTIKRVIEVDPRASVEELKALIARRLGMDATRMTLEFKRRVLADSDRLSDVGVEARSVLNLTHSD